MYAKKLIECTVYDTIYITFPRKGLSNYCTSGTTPLQPLFFLYTNEDMVFKFYLSHVSPCNICKRSQGIYPASIIYLYFIFFFLLPYRPLLASSSVEHLNISRMKWISGIVGHFIVEIQGMFGCSFSGFRRALLGVFTCIFALGGAIVGIITGALKGQTTETGFVRGAGIGAVTGAVTAVQLLELVINGESLSKVALFCSLVDGKAFMEWVGPAVLKAYQWQVSTLETSYAEVSDLYDTEDSARGLSRGCIERLPVSVFADLKDPVHGGCSICLQDFEGGEYGRRLPNCGHIFHLGCLDSWLIICGSCPMCRESVYYDNHQF